MWPLLHVMYILLLGFLTSSLGQRPHLVDVGLCVVPVNLHCNKLLFRARRGFGHGHWLKRQRRGRRRSREWRWRGRWRGRGSRFGAPVRGLDPGERANVVLGDHRQLSSCYLFFLGRYRGISLSDGGIVPRWVPGVFSFVVHWGRGGCWIFAVVVGRRGCEVQPRVGGFGRGAFVELISSARASLHPRRGRRLEGGGGFSCVGLYVVLKWEDIFIID